MNNFSITKFVHPPGKHLCRKILEIVYLRSYSLRTPFMSIIHESSIFVEKKQVSPACPIQSTHISKSGIDGLINVGILNKSGRNISNDFFKFQPPLERLPHLFISRDVSTNMDGTG